MENAAGSAIPRNTPATEPVTFLHRYFNGFGRHPLHYCSMEFDGASLAHDGEKRLERSSRPPKTLSGRRAPALNAKPFYRGLKPTGTQNDHKQDEQNQDDTSGRKEMTGKTSRHSSFPPSRGRHGRPDSTYSMGEGTIGMCIYPVPGKMGIFLVDGGNVVESEFVGNEQRYRRH